MCRQEEKLRPRLADEIELKVWTGDDALSHSLNWENFCLRHDIGRVGSILLSNLALWIEAVGPYLEMLVVNFHMEMF